MNRLIRKIVFTTFISILIASGASAAFSEFIKVNPTNEAAYKISVKVSACTNHQYLFQIKAPMVDDIKNCWLIICKSKLKPAQQEFRDYIWNNKSKRSDVLLKVKIVPTKKGFIRFTLHKELVHKAYIYIDFPQEVYDGGYYYSIDLSNYIKNLKK